MDPDIVALINGLQEGSRVAAVTMTGSCCPVTLAHIKCFMEARRILLGEVARPRGLEKFHEVYGFLSLNSDLHVSTKIHEPCISYANRSKLVRLAVSEHRWITLSRSSDGLLCRQLQQQRPDLEFVWFTLSWSDDILKGQRWKECTAERRFIAMCRSGYSMQLCNALTHARMDPDMGHFIVGPEIPQISSAAIRRALGEGDASVLGKFLHPAVADWCLSMVAEWCYSQATAEHPFKPGLGSSFSMPSLPGSNLQSCALGARQRCDPNQVWRSPGTRDRCPLPPLAMGMSRHRCPPVNLRSHSWTFS